MPEPILVMPTVFTAPVRHSLQPAEDPTSADTALVGGAATQRRTADRQPWLPLQNTTLVRADTEHERPIGDGVIRRDAPCACSQLPHPCSRHLAAWSPPPADAVEGDDSGDNPVANKHFSTHDDTGVIAITDQPDMDGLVMPAGALTLPDTPVLWTGSTHSVGNSDPQMIKLESQRRRAAHPMSIQITARHSLVAAHEAVNEQNRRTT